MREFNSLLLGIQHQLLLMWGIKIFSDTINQLKCALRSCILNLLQKDCKKISGFSNADVIKIYIFKDLLELEGEGVPMKQEFSRHGTIHYTGRLSCNIALGLLIEPTSVHVNEMVDYTSSV